MGTFDEVKGMEGELKGQSSLGVIPQKPLSLHCP